MSDAQEATSKQPDVDEAAHDEAIPDDSAANGQTKREQPEDEVSEIEQLRRTVAERIGSDDEEDEQVALDALGVLAQRAEQTGETQADLAEAQDQLMRKAASLQNVRRRAREEQARSSERARADVLRRVLDVLDDFDRSLEAADQDDGDTETDHETAHRSLREGVEMIREKLRGVLQALDVEPIEAVGEPFDEQLHEAMMRQPAPDDAEPGDVLHEVQKGYRMKDRILRHSRVVVAGPREESDAA